MEEVSQELQLHIIARNHEDHATGNFTTPSDLNNQDANTSIKPESRRPYKWYLKVAAYSFLVLSGQAVATLLGRQYYDNGGSSKWLATLVQLCGFPILVPYYFLFSSSSSNQSPINCPAEAVELSRADVPPFRVLVSVYVFLGIVVAVDCYLYSVGLQYVPVSTYSLICTSQLAFNALFSFFLNSQKFTPFIVNSLVLLTISSVILVFQTDSENPTGVTKAKYVIGFICTVAASAGYALMLSLTQLVFKKVIKKQTFEAVMDMVIYQCLVATLITVAALFGSGEWKHLAVEMEQYELGKTSYVMNLLWTAVSWQVFSIGSTGLIFDASSLFSNAISVVGLPLIPFLAVIFFHDRMDGMKVVAMVLAIWGFVSYLYQHYVDDSESKDRASHDR
ncbi:hypothetical protein SAY87_030583 [Trapa incisa]|uniref:Probable purine permease n=1 Tax=Trapa incisa TaxID=236973 RepID=A0AAN7KMN2_9MYRT|nr:hypothetical protein SAY87_030583 [Trapa incisa]